MYKSTLFVIEQLKKGAYINGRSVIAYVGTFLYGIIGNAHSLQ